ncbi:BUD13 homolog [Coffea eugenioides]|uniref:BUD13 homolog n=1 Tax=Coffea arabica TaxID=13443 RepID=A0A6P6TCY5_COFAR|nr:BUD13 homolog [Coffea arabica]XP_027075746.1 BUD13 homolog [Coffea arabica]XP_027075752.1 BUD13 homolog [Coffea arabica]XP_027075760.1 BUD13 homolog [Coffea arabica]XP_027075766.1 BUD13 homolog [Coffea arabica]XP_027170120.1 BUD13 homolog [Coffea eugenioides]XP_027178733.1 BUD13 homolog [Coffea eugenioides]
MAGASSSLKEYLKRYQDGNEEEDKKKKKKKKKAKQVDTGVVVVDEDPIWQKPVRIEEEEENDSADEEKPLVDEDIEVKRMKRLELLRARRPFGSISEDGSGWVSISDAPKTSNFSDKVLDISPPRRRRADTPSPEHDLRSSSGRDADLSPPRKRRVRNDTPSPEPMLRPPGTGDAESLLERTRTTRNDSPSPEPDWRSRATGADFSPPRQRQKHYLKEKDERDISPPRRRKASYDTSSSKSGFGPSESRREVVNLSPPRRQRVRHLSPSPLTREETSSPGDPDSDLSPPRRFHQDHLHTSPVADLSPPRKGRKDRYVSSDLSARQATQHLNENDAVQASSALDLSPPRKRKEKSPTSKQQVKTGLVTGQDLKEEIARKKKEDMLRFKEMDPSISGRGAEPVYRDKVTGKRMSKDEFLKSQKKEEKPKEVKLEWGKGLAQKREAEARLQELESEKDKPFARRRDDPELDRMLKERVRWGDPMAHLVKKKQFGPVMEDLGDDEKMKESGFIIPQEIPSHSWLRRGLDAAPNRYGIKPGRHWDGVDRSSGFEKQMFKRMNEKQATEREAYLWSVSDM